MKGNKKIVLSVPEELYDSLNELNINIADVALSALQKIVNYTKQEDDLKRGYEEMANINLGLAENDLEVENEAFEIIEHHLSNDLTESE